MNTNKWTFKTLPLDPRGSTELIDLSQTQIKKAHKYARALQVGARSTVANPPFSNYFVKGSIFPLDGMTSMETGNIEYGICQALHGEESAVAALRSFYGRVSGEEVVHAIVAGNPGNIAAPCGNCRDIMLEDLGLGLEIVCGAPEGGVAVVATMEHYTFSDFRQMEPKIFDGPLLANAKIAILIGGQLVNDAYSPENIHPERRYHAAIQGRKNLYVGARDVMCEYHPIYALRDAIRQARRANDPFISHVVIVCEDFGGGAPHVMYKDRQHLLEMNLERELLTGLEVDPSVFLVTHKGGEITGVWETSVKEWLPYPFSPRNFGPEFIKFLTDYYKKRRQ